MMKHIKKSIRFLITALAVLMVPFSASAQKKDKKGRRTTINFEDQLIKGQNQKPDLLYLLQKKQFNYKRLIRLREDFLPEMRETGFEIDEGTQPKLRRPKRKKE